MRSENTVELLTAIVVGSSVTATIYYVRLGGDIDNVRRQKCEENVQCATADAVPAWLLTAVALTCQSLVQLALMGYGYRSYLDFGWRIFKVRVRVRAPNPNPDPNPSPNPNPHPSPNPNSHPHPNQVAGVVNSTRPDAKSAQYLATIKQGDFLLNRVQKLSRVINLDI